MEEHDLVQRILLAAQDCNIDVISKILLNNPQVLRVKDEYGNMPLHIYLSSPIVDLNVLMILVDGCPSTIKSSGMTKNI